MANPLAVLREERWNDFDKIMVSQEHLKVIIADVFKLENRFNILGYLIESRITHDHTFLNCALAADADAEVWTFLIQRLYHKRKASYALLCQLLPKISATVQQDKKITICKAFLMPSTQIDLMTVVCKYVPDLIPSLNAALDDGNVLMGFVVQYVTDKDQFADTMCAIAEKCPWLRVKILYDCCGSLAEKHLILLRKMLVFVEDITNTAALKTSLFVHALHMDNFSAAECILTVNDLSNERLTEIAQYLTKMPRRLFIQIVNLQPTVLDKCLSLHKLSSKTFTYVLTEYPQVARRNYLFHKCMSHKTRTSHLVVLLSLLIDQIDVRDEDGRTPMHHAFSIHEWHHARILAANGSNAFFMRDKYGCCPIMCAATRIPLFVLLDWLKVDPMFIYSPISSYDYIASFTQEEPVRIALDHLKAPLGFVEPETVHLPYIPNRDKIQKDAMEAYLSVDILTLVVNYSIILENNH